MGIGDGMFGGWWRSQLEAKLNDLESRSQTLGRSAQVMNWHEFQQSYHERNQPRKWDFFGMMGGAFVGGIASAGGALALTAIGALPIGITGVAAAVGVAGGGVLGSMSPTEFVQREKMVDAYAIYLSEVEKNLSVRGRERQPSENVTAPIVPIRPQARSPIL